jgi:hypothetical protein
MGIYTQAIQQLYVAYFARPADVAGLQYWETVDAANQGDISAISATFAKAPEYLADYAGKSNTQVVDQVYINMFGRHAELDGLLYWSNLLDRHAITLDNVVTTVVRGALGSDATAFNNKVATASAFTGALAGSSCALTYDGGQANAVLKAFLAGVTDHAPLINVDGVNGGMRPCDILNGGSTPVIPAMPGIAVGEPNPNGMHALSHGPESVAGVTLIGQEGVGHAMAWL